MSEQNTQVERLTLAKAITRGLDDAMADNRKVVLIGEDIGKLGGVYRVTEGLLAKHGQKRVMDSPLGEAGIVGTSIGEIDRRSMTSIERPSSTAASAAASATGTSGPYATTVASVPSRTTCAWNGSKSVSAKFTSPLSQ